MHLLTCIRKWFHFEVILFVFFARLFSEKTRGIAIALASSLSGVIVVAVVQKRWHFVISLVNTEDIYLKLGICVHYPKRNPKIKGDNSKCIFFRIYAPVSKDRGHIVLPLSVCPSVRLSVYTNLT